LNEKLRISKAGFNHIGLMKRPIPYFTSNI